MDYRNYNDNELIYMVRENDEDSVDLLSRKYAPIIFRLSNEYYRKYTGSIYEFDDFYIEALSAFHKALNTYDSNMNVLFYTYVNVCIKRALTSFGRVISSNKNIENSIDISNIEYAIEDYRENINDRDFYRGLENIIKNVIFSLPLEAGSIIELKINGFTYKEISKLLDIPISSVEFKSRRARKMLRTRIKEYYCK